MAKTRSAYTYAIQCHRHQASVNSVTVYSLTAVHLPVTSDLFSAADVSSLRRRFVFTRIYSSPARDLVTSRLDLRQRMNWRWQWLLGGYEDVWSGRSPLAVGLNALVIRLRFRRDLALTKDDEEGFILTPRTSRVTELNDRKGPNIVADLCQHWRWKAVIYWYFGIFVEVRMFQIPLLII